MKPVMKPKPKPAARNDVQKPLPVKPMAKVAKAKKK
jgi:hypothetical protein